MAGNITTAPETLTGVNVSVPKMLVDRVAATPDAPAFKYPDNGNWQQVTWAEFKTASDEVAAGLLSLGIELEQRVGIASNTRYLWILADMGVMRAGAATTTVYPSTGSEDVAYILGDSGCRIVFAEDDSQVAKLRERRDELPDLGKVVVFDGAGDGDWVITMDELRSLGRDHLAANPSSVDDRSNEVTPDSLATLIYTSGTTGKPKGVELLHSCWTYEGAAMASLGIITIDDVQFLWLPLAHSFGKVLLSAGLQVGFLTAVDGRVPKIAENLGVVKPTIMAGVPRVFEKIYNGVNQMQETEGGFKLMVYGAAVDTGKKHTAAGTSGKGPSALMKVRYGISDKLVFSKIRERFGGNIRFFISGSAALSKDVAVWFASAGMPIIEGYGLTETSAATCVVRPSDLAFGTIGMPLPGTEIMIAEDGEILVRGPGVMRGYHALDEQTAEVMLADGWFATGDIGEIDDKGYVKITDRKKDLVKTSGGKYIAPGAIESQFKAICPIASQMLVHANNRNFASAIITLDPDALASWCSSNGVTASDYAAQTQDPTVQAFVQACIDDLNTKLNRWETIKKFIVPSEDFSEEAGQLTPSLKLKRKVVETQYAEQLDALYG